MSVRLISVWGKVGKWGGFDSLIAVGCSLFPVLYSLSSFSRIYTSTAESSKIIGNWELGIGNPKSIAPAWKNASLNQPK